MTRSLLALVAPPGEPRQGEVDALRLDLAEMFVDAAGLPDDGWLEIESITLR
ncbi:MAG: hypothetical protein ACI8PZ_004279 [Myxococcota bacterium]|jgi:hypothetical protein